MRQLLIVALLAPLAFGLFVACGNDDTERDNGSTVGDDSVPTEITGIDENATIDFAGQRWKIVDVVTRAEPDDMTGRYTEVGVVERASVELEGEVKVYRKDGDGGAIYTDPLRPQSGGSEGPHPLYLRWIPQGK
jgi:hypothetical protein